METSLHRQLKLLYAGPKARFEASVGKYRADVLDRGRVIEIQHGPLGAIRDKVRTLLEDHRVLVVKPIIATKYLVKQSEKGGGAVSRRKSPKRGEILSVFDELVHFTKVFPHARLTLELVLVDVEELRYPGHGRRRRWRESDHEVEDQRLLEVHQTRRLRTATDLRRLIDCPLPEVFHTGDLAAALSVKRWVAQRIAYCFDKMGVAEQVGKLGNARLYRFVISG